jgi:hypothetical protein
MTKVELALILKIIDSHTKYYNPNYLPEGVGVREEIDSIQGLKDDIVTHYNEVMKDKGEETI